MSELSELSELAKRLRLFSDGGKYPIANEAAAALDAADLRLSQIDYLAGTVEALQQELAEANKLSVTEHGKYMTTLTELTRVKAERAKQPDSSRRELSETAPALERPPVPACWHGNAGSEWDHYKALSAYADSLERRLPKPHSTTDCPICGPIPPGDHPPAKSTKK